VPQCSSAHVARPLLARNAVPGTRRLPSGFGPERRNEERQLGRTSSPPLRRSGCDPAYVAITVSLRRGAQASRTEARPRVARRGPEGRTQRSPATNLVSTAANSGFDRGPVSSTPTRLDPAATVIGSHEFRNRFGWYMERAAAGEPIMITRRGKPHLRLSAASPELRLAA